MIRLLISLLLCFTINQPISVLASSYNAETLYNLANEELNFEKISKAEEKLVQVIKQYPKTKYATYSIDKLIKLYDEAEKIEKLINIYKIGKAKSVVMPPRSTLTVAFHYIFTIKDQAKENATLLLKSIDVNQLSTLEEREYRFLQIVNLVQKGKNEDANIYIDSLIKKFPDYMRPLKN